MSEQSVLLYMVVAGFLVTANAETACKKQEEETSETGPTIMMLVLLMAGVAIGILYEKLMQALKQPTVIEAAADERPLLPNANTPMWSPKVEAGAQTQATDTGRDKPKQETWPELAATRYGDCYHRQWCECVTTSRHATRTMRPCSKCMG